MYEITHVLIVDDAKRFEGFALFKTEYQAHHVQNQRAAMAFLRSHSDVAILIINLEKSIVNSLALLTAVRQNEQFQSMIIWICVDSQDEQTVEQYYAAGADAIIHRYQSKTIQHEQLHRLLNAPARYYGKAGKATPSAQCTLPGNMLTDKILQEDYQRLQAIINAVPGGVALYDLSGEPRLLYYNDVLTKLCNFSPEEYEQIMAIDYRQLIDPRDRKLVENLIASFRSQPQKTESFFRIQTKDHLIRWVHASAIPMGNATQCGVVFIDITQDKETEFKNKRIRNELYYRIDHDALTGISNRESFYRKTEELMHASPETPFVVIMIDIDRFKVINDMFGKEVGDQILISIAEGLETMLGSRGTCARMEADHFAACMPQDMLEMEHIIEVFNRGLRCQNLDFNIQLSYGIYTVRNINTPVNHMCDRAMMALRTIKGNALRRYAYYDDHLRQTLLAENAILDEMNYALQQGQFALYLQPVFTVDTQQPVFVEALVRWQHPEKGVIQPNQFIPLFERNGFITKLDYYVWEHACALLSKWKVYQYNLPISVNISRIDLYSTHLCDDLQMLVHKYNIEPSSLRLEITESAYNKDPDELLLTINRLRSMGFVVLMDDFGSGYSSLNVLMDMPVDIIKLDMRFIAKLNTNPRAASVLTSIVRMTKWLNMPVIAEGVENLDQLAFLRSIGCDMAQGFLLAKPLDVASYTQLFVDSHLQNDPIRISAPQPSVDLSSLWGSSAGSDMLFNGMVGGMGIYELSSNALEVRRVNDGYYELFGCTPKQVFDGAREVLNAVHADDRKGLLDTCRKAAQSGQVERVELRHIHYRENREIWVETRLRHMGKTGLNDVFFFTFNDITQLKEFEQARALHNYAAVLRSVYADVIELNLTSQSIRIVHSSTQKDPNPDTTKPAGWLKERFHKSLLNQDDELENHLFMPGYLRQKIAESQSDYYLVERRIHSGNKHSRWASFTFIPLPTDTNEEIYLLCIADVDSRKRAEALLIENQWLQVKQQEQSRYQELLEHLGTSLFDWDTANGNVISSQSFNHYSASDYDFSTLSSHKDLEPYIYPQDHKMYWTLVNDLLAHGSGSCTIRLLKKDGTPVWCRVLCSHVTDERTHHTRFIAAINQVDEQVKTEENYLREQNQFRAFADNFMVGLAIFEMHGKQQRILYVSNGYRRMIGYEPSEVFYDADHSYSTIHPDDVERFEKATSDLVDTGIPFKIDYRVFHKDKHIMWMRSFNSIYPTAEPGVYRIYAVIEEITELKALQTHFEHLLTRMPMGIGIYHALPTPSARVENEKMKTFWSQSANKELIASSDPGEKEPSREIRTRADMLRFVRWLKQQNKLSGDARLTLIDPGQLPQPVRLFYAVHLLADQEIYYCIITFEQPST